ncbi:MAG: PD-(D/E)XK motif protein [Methanoregula sp.]|jgi:hypothetical protein|uniref:PD-(D/E)XK motif protein n=1 Tax=Methanoregula sp. TaxID=2052170 RepID=UPI003C1CA03D
MEKFSPELWTLLASNVPSGEKLSAKPASPDHSLRVFGAIDSGEQRHILIQLADDDISYTDHQSRGIQVTTQEMSIPGQHPSRYIDLVCLDPAGYSGFDLIGNELTSGMSKENPVPGEVVHNVLARWRRFWGQLPLDLLSRNEIIGLIAELRFLSERLIPEVEPEEAVKRWRGPFGSRHDFECPGWSVEVKATTSSRGRIFHINGLDQLDPPENGKLFFFGVRLREEGGAEQTLPRIIEACRNLLIKDDEAFDKFEYALVQAGYSPHHNEEYEKMHFRIIEEALFEVVGDFPRISAGNFTGEIPAGIERVEYEINLNGFDHRIVFINEKPYGV